MSLIPLSQRAERKIVSELSEEINSLLPKKLTHDKLKKLVLRVRALSSTRLRKILHTQLKKLWNKRITEISNEYGYDIGFGQSDENILQAIMNNRKLTRSLKRINTVAGQRMETIVDEGLMRGKTLTEIRDKLEEVLNVTEYRAGLIARVESQKVQTLARENSYNKIVNVEDSRFKWIGPDDYRTTDICKRIRRRTRNGVSLPTLKRIIKEESDATFYDDSSPFSPHFSCRHDFVRIR